MSEVDTALTEQIELGSGEPVPDALEEEESSTSTDETSAEPEKPKARGVQKRLDELTAQRYAEQRAREDAQRDRDYWRELALKSQKAPEQPKPEAPKGKPNVADFASYEEYTEAVADWKVQDALTRREAEMQQQRAQYEAMTLREQFDAKARQFEAQAPDWRQVVTSIPLSDAAFQAAQQSDMGPALLYHLGKNPQLAEQIYSMTPYQQAMRLGRLEVELSQPKPKRISGAPEPINPVGGSDGSIAYDPNTGTADDYRRWREQQKSRK